MKSTEWLEIKEIFVAAFELPIGERAAFIADFREDVRLEVEKLLTASDAAGDFIDEPAVIELGLTGDDETDFYVGKQIDAYKIIREIGHGGMGTVYLANRADESFDKPVALKLIKRGMDTTAVLKRFMMERRILAQLQHPNIAALLDGGTTPDGLPFFVMEYVDGEPITVFCNSHEHSIRERLELFREVCTAVSYAHQNLVVHRDIKPSNIVVSREGTPKLLDFGIAKLLNPDWSLDTNEATATMFRLMTPEYSSPEQIRGLPITTSSDVYSLGVVLYELLSGERPYKIESRTTDEVSRIVLTSAPIKPSSVISRRLSFAGKETNDIREQTNPRSKIQNLKLLRGDLDNIILKALRKEPERRYASVQELSEDIRRHLGGLPVTATADTSIYRFNKFVKRHRVGVFAGGFIILTLLIATAITAWQAVIARQERDKARQRFNQVRKLANTVLFEYHDGIAKLTGSTPIREKMVKDAVEYLDNLAGESNGDVGLQSEIATAYQKVGDVQGNPYQGNLGNIEGSIASYRKSQAIRQNLVAENPTDADMRRSLAKSYESIGDMFWTKGEYAEAENNYRENLRINSELIVSENGKLEDSFGIARARHRIGQALSRTGDLDGALENFNLSLEKYQEITAAAPNEKKYALGKGSAILKIGDIQAAKGDSRSALENHRTGLEIWSVISAAEPLNAVLKRNVAIATDRTAEDLRDMENYSEALKISLQAVQLQQEIAAADPTNVQFSSELGLSYVHLGNIQGKLKQFSGARENVLKGLKVLQQFADASPQWIDLRRDLALSCAMAGDVFRDEGTSIEAAEQYRKSAELLETFPLRTELREKLAQNYRNIGTLDLKAHHFEDAKVWLQKSLAIWTELNIGQTRTDPTESDEIGKLIDRCEIEMRPINRNDHKVAPVNSR